MMTFSNNRKTTGIALGGFAAWTLLIISMALGAGPAEAKKPVKSEPSPSPSPTETYELVIKEPFPGDQNETPPQN